MSAVTPTRTENVVKPLPSAVYEACPSAPQGSGVILDRPWWRMLFLPSPFAGNYVRSDNILMLMPDDLNQKIVFGPPSVIGMELHTAFMELDRKHPIKHPGIRAGQIWCDRFGNSTQVLRFGRNTVFHMDGKARYVSAVTPDEFQADGYEFLLGDPCCPHLAPWSVSEPL